MMQGRTERGETCGALLEERLNPDRARLFPPPLPPLLYLSEVNTGCVAFIRERPCASKGVSKGV